MSFTEPVPLGTWQSSVLISVKLLMFHGDVLFFWQGSVLINVTSILHVGILVSSGIPHEILFTHPKTVVLSTFFPNPGGRGMPNPTVITTDLEAAFPTDEKGVAFDFLVRRHSSCFPCFARVCILVLNI